MQLQTIYGFCGFTRYVPTTHIQRVSKWVENLSMGNRGDGTQQKKKLNQKFQTAANKFEGNFQL